MCFSATASLTASAILGCAGTISVKQVRNHSEYGLAAIPLLFAIQQVAEGLVWMSFTGNSDYQQAGMLIFLLFAQVIWPVWIPASVLLLEANRIRKQWLLFTLIAGISCAALLGYRMCTHQFNAEIQEHHIRYSIVSSSFLSNL